MQCTRRWAPWRLKTCWWGSAATATASWPAATQAGRTPHALRGGFGGRATGAGRPGAGSRTGSRAAERAVLGSARCAPSLRAATSLPRRACQACCAGVELVGDETFFDADERFSSGGITPRAGQSAASTELLGEAGAAKAWLCTWAMLLGVAQPQWGDAAQAPQRASACGPSARQPALVFQPPLLALAPPADGCCCITCRHPSLHAGPAIAPPKDLAEFTLKLLQPGSPEYDGVDTSLDVSLRQAPAPAAGGSWSWAVPGPTVSCRLLVSRRPAAAPGTRGPSGWPRACRCHAWAVYSLKLWV